jgi:Ca2+-binding RTX toxin-like protein
MSKYEYDDDDRYEDDDDNRKEHHDDDDDDVIPTPTPTPTPNAVDVIINQPTVNITNNTTTINTVIENVIVNPPVPVPPIPPAPEPITNYIYGTRNNDYLTGTDLNDVIYGYQGNDTLIDGLGADKLYGAKGKNTYYCTADGQTDFIYVKRDNKADVIKSVGIEDRIDVKGSKFTFAETSAGIEIYYKHSLQAIYTGGELSLSQIQSITV